MRDDLVADDFRFTTVAEVVAHGPPAAFGDRVFVRPDSPLKPFSGRVLERGCITFSALDHGFYYDDENLAIVVTPVVDVGREWRFVVASGRVVAGSEYAAVGRVAVTPVGPRSPAWAYAQRLAPALEPEPVFVLDVVKPLRDCGFSRSTRSAAPISMPVTGRPSLRRSKPW
ncbi:ATP-grasp domain-containing protein [Ammonicoccus fulvus]|uniref:ATP-grasp domain-containing protein n=1 Tax=Ammonicoccus fulvus TaxID=3138240 RepID=A0ABZ3FVC0_9ACTN